MGASCRAPASVFGRDVKLTPSHRLYGLGAILLVSLTICSHNFSRTGEPSFCIPLGVAGVAYLLAIRELLYTPKFPRRVIVFGLALAALWHFQFLRMPSGLDDDIHRYLWDGRVQRLGYNPYILVPSDPALAGLHTSETRTLNNPEVPSPYPAGAQLFFRAVTSIHESTFALKVAFVVCDMVIVFVLLDVLCCTRQGQHWVLAYAWHPLLAIEGAGSGHVDIVGVLLLLVSAASLLRRWRSVAAIAFGLAVAFAWPMAASLLCAPVIYPWYLLWLLPFIRSTSTVPIMIWTLSIIPTYYVWHLRTVGRPWLVPDWIMMLEYGSVAVAAAIIVFRRITRSAALRCSANQVE